MTTGDVELVLQGARERYPNAQPRLITDNGGQFVSKQFKGFLHDCGYTHVRTSPEYPQSNGKMERQFRTIKEVLRSQSILSYDDMIAHLERIIDDYNFRRYHSALGYVTPMDMLMGRADRIQRESRVKLDEAKERRILVHSHLFNSGSADCCLQILLGCPTWIEALQNVPVPKSLIGVNPVGSALQLG